EKKERKKKLKASFPLRRDRPFLNLLRFLLIIIPSLISISAFPNSLLSLSTCSPSILCLNPSLLSRINTILRGGFRLKGRYCVQKSSEVLVLGDQLL
uniref:Uncharacterized protein n=1 Tax=Cucumis melo TaxID=3656 RepID=A0A9I9DVA9_CUCME